MVASSFNGCRDGVAYATEDTGPKRLSPCCIVVISLLSSSRPDNSGEIELWLVLGVPEVPVILLGVTVPSLPVQLALLSCTSEGFILCNTNEISTAVGNKTVEELFMQIVYVNSMYNLQFDVGKDLYLWTNFAGSATGTPLLRRFKRCCRATAFE